MRKRRSVFLDSLIALAISWGTAYYYGRQAAEVIFPVFSALGLLCLIILIPFALKNLPPGGAFKRGAAFAVSLCPLLVMLSHPLFFLDPFYQVWLNLGIGSTYTWIFKGVINFLIFLLVGYIFSRKFSPDKVTWKKSFITLLIMLILYTVIFYTGAELFGYYPYL